MNHFKTRKDLIASFAKDTVGVEVGVQAGVFSQEILDCGVKHLYLVDPWEHQTGEYEKDPANIDQGGQDALYRSVVEKFGNDPRVTIHRGYSGNVAHDFKEELDFIYLDGRHDEDGVFYDLECWGRQITDEGIICGHDYTDSAQARGMGFGVKKAVDAFCRMHDWKMVALTGEEWPSFALARDFIIPRPNLIEADVVNRWRK